MGADKDSQVSSDRKKWRSIFNALAHMLLTQQTRVESLSKERKLLENRIKFQYNQWLFDVQSLQDQIGQMKMDYDLQEKERLFEAAKSDFMMGLKKKEVSFCKLKLEHTDSELAEFKVLVDFLSQKCLDPIDDNQGTSKRVDSVKGRKGESTKEEEQHRKKLEGEVRKLKQEYEILVSENSAKVSVLLAEQKFVWNQYKIMESNYCDKLNRKCAEVEQANERVGNLLAGMQQLESLNNEKDEKIVRLETDLAKMEIEMKKKNEEISRLSEKVEVLRKFGRTPVTPMLNSCMEKRKIYSLGGKGMPERKILCVKKELLTASATNMEKKIEEQSGKKSRCGSKRKGIDDVTPTSDTPRLFSSTFRIPKLKCTSPQLKTC